MAYTSPVQAQIMKELDLSTADFSLFGSMINIGGVFGAIICGRLADYLGRKHVLRLTVLFYIIGWLSIATGQSACLLDLGRWLLGFAMIIANYVIPVYVAEFAPKNLRGGFVILHALMIGVGASVVFLIGLVTSWRTLALIGTIPSLVIVGLFFIPESPRWLLMKSKNNEFETVLQCLRGGFVVDEAADLRESIEALHQMEKVSFLQLFQKRYAYTFTVGIGLEALCHLVGLNGILFYASSIFESAGFSATVGTIALALIQIYFVSYPVGMGGAASVIVSEIYPLNVKGLAGSICSIVACLAGWIVSYTFNFLMEWSSSGTFFIMAGISAFTLVFVTKLVPETKGRTLEEVHASTSIVWQ